MQISELKKNTYPIKVLQFGEGNFLRGFCDHMIQLANQNQSFNGDIVVVKPISHGDISHFKRQNCNYTVLLRGRVDKRIISTTCQINAIREIVDCTESYQAYLELACLDSLRFVISNTTEAGIRLDDNDDFNQKPAKSFPAKLTQFLYKRATYFNLDLTKGLVFLPVELIDYNGDKLKQCVLSCCQKWGLSYEFVEWINQSCVFCNTLVDRIISGYPKNEITELQKELGYSDELLVIGEPFGLWVIESKIPLEDELPLSKALIGDELMQVIFTDNHVPYKQRKVRILNGAHTSFALASYLKGNNTVLDSMNDSVIVEYMKKTLYQEIIPTLDLPENQLYDFAEAVIDRFRNPFIKHELLSISLNSVAKWKERLYPSLLGYLENRQQIPHNLLFSLAALIAFYRGQYNDDLQLMAIRNNQSYEIKDDRYVMDFFNHYAEVKTCELVQNFIKMELLFENQVLKDECEAWLVKYVDSITELGIDKTCRLFGLCA